MNILIDKVVGGVIGEIVFQKSGGADSLLIRQVASRQK